MQNATTYRVHMAGGQQYGPASLDVVVQWAREGRVATDAVLVGSDGASAGVMSVPQIAAVLNAPSARSPAPPAPGPVPPAPGGDEMLATLVPYRNKPALIGYYAAIVGTLLAILLPAFGFALVMTAKGGAGGGGGGSGGGGLIAAGGLLCLLGIAAPFSAIVMGMKGRRLARENPRSHGRVHAWIGILGGTFGTLLALIFSAMFVFMSAAKP
jgi:hypothetical protein